jgi:hypothetical protein
MKGLRMGCSRCLLKEVESTCNSQGTTAREQGKRLHCKQLPWVGVCDTEDAEQ